MKHLISQLSFRRKAQYFRYISAAMALMAGLFTVAALMLPALTLTDTTQEPDSSYQVEQHTDASDKKSDTPTEETVDMPAQTFEAADGHAEVVEPLADQMLKEEPVNNEIVFDAEQFSAYGIVYKTDFKDSVNGEMYEVTVTCDESANIPTGSALRVTEFSEEDAEYEYARKAVLADKKTRGEWIDMNSFGLAALDISIIDPEGNEIEPDSTAHVDIRIKELPGVEDLNDVASSIEIQHHIETGDKVVVDTVYDGRTADAKFDVVSNEKAITEGTAVDPDSYNVIELCLYSSVYEPCQYDRHKIQKDGG